MWALASITRCASAASASGYVACTTGRTGPASTSGQTCSRTLRTIAAFSASGRPRSEVAKHRDPLAQHQAEVELGLGAALQPDDDQPPVAGQDRRRCGRGTSPR